MMNQCVSCGQPFSTGDKFCFSCGAALPISPVQASAECRVCRVPLAPEDRFCGKCGSEVDRQPPASASKQIQRQRPADEPRRKITRATRRPPDAPESVPGSEVWQNRERYSGRPSRWWPKSITGRIAFPMITAASGVIGLLGSKGNIATAGILAVAALAFLTFWRNVWISWAMPSATSKKNPTGEAGVAEGREGGGMWQTVAGFVILLILLAIARSCGRDIIRAIF